MCARAPLRAPGQRKQWLSGGSLWVPLKFLAHPRFLSAANSADARLRPGARLAAHLSPALTPGLAGGADAHLPSGAYFNRIPTSSEHATRASGETFPPISGGGVR